MKTIGTSSSSTCCCCRHRGVLSGRRSFSFHRSQTDVTLSPIINTFTDLIRGGVGLLRLRLSNNSVFFFSLEGNEGSRAAYFTRGLFLLQIAMPQFQASKSRSGQKLQQQQPKIDPPTLITRKNNNSSSRRHAFHLQATNISLE